MIKPTDKIRTATKKACRNIEWNRRHAWNKVDETNAVRGDYWVQSAERSEARRNKEIAFLVETYELTMVEAHAMFDGFRFKTA